MGKNSTIEWTDHTFNPWMGCTKVSPGCANCYAERDMDHRWGKVKWGKGSPRVRTSPANWQKPKQWNAAAAKAGRRDRVFCSSLADVFDEEVDPQWRNDLFVLIEATPHLDWLLLTKRPHLVLSHLEVIKRHWMCDGLPGLRLGNVWMGTSVEDQQRADERIMHLLGIPARVRFLSCEPLLGPVDLRLPLNLCPVKKSTISAETGEIYDHGWVWERNNPMGRSWIGTGIHWIIAGGESGPKARPMHPEWAKTLRDQAQAAGVPFLFKQWGEWAPFYNEAHFTHGGEEQRAHCWLMPNGDSGDCWVFDEDGGWSNHTGDPPNGQATVMGHHGKHAAGRELGGRTWDEVPTP